LGEPRLERGCDLLVVVLEGKPGFYLGEAGERVRDEDPALIDGK
jgi:hypothetical protein